MINRLLNIGVDFGIRKIAVACFDECWAQSYQVRSMGDRGEELHLLAEQYGEFIPWRTETHLWIEGAITAGPKNVQTAVSLAATQGAILSAHYGPATIVPISSWKHGTVGNGSATKEDVWLWLAEYHVDRAAVCHTQDEVDAMCLSLYGRLLTDGDIEPPIPRKPKKRKAKT